MKESIEISILSPKAQTAVEAFNSPQVSLIKKHNPVELGIRFVKILREMYNEISCGFDDTTVSDVAASLLNQFYMLRFNEFVFAIRSGMAGKYGKVTFAPITKAILSQWLTVYMETDRLEAEEIYRNKFKAEFLEAQENVELVAKEKIAELGKKFHMQSRFEENDRRQAITNESIDRKTFQLVYALDYYGNLPDADLFKFKSDAEKHNWPETLKFCNDEIQKRSQKAGKENPGKEYGDSEKGK